jgi:hypothetical protein
MRILKIRLLAWVFGGVFAIAVNAFAQQPPDVVQSDPSGNTAMGTGVLSALTTGAFFNTASGFQALQSNTTGFNNAAFGGDALQFNTTGFNNIALGGQALQFNTTGSNNIALGAGALFINTTGSNNTASGGGSL